MSKLIDLMGKKFGRWTVINRASNKGRKTYWLCQCDCGRKKDVWGCSLTSLDSTSCGCYCKELSSERNKIEYGLSAKNSLFSIYKNTAKRRKLFFGLSFDEFLNLVQQECYYCCSEPSNIRKTFRYNGDFIYNGIDRKDNDKGYTIENCVPCCKICNKAKNTLTYEEFIKWGESLGKNLEVLDEGSRISQSI